jgi:hypothetical protein
MNSQVLRKVLKVVGLLLLTTLGLIIVISVMVSVFYEKALVHYMKKYLDEHLLTELSMDDVQFRLLKGFPKATVEISNAVLLSGESFEKNVFKGAYADTLLNAQSVLLQFNSEKLKFPVPVLTCFLTNRTIITCISGNPRVMEALIR